MAYFLLSFSETITNRNTTYNENQIKIYLQKSIPRDWQYTIRIRLRIWTESDDIRYRSNIFLEVLATSCCKKNVHGHPAAFVDIQDIYEEEIQIEYHPLGTYWTCT